MKDDVRKKPLEAALRAVIDSLIERSSLSILTDFADGIADDLADGTVADVHLLNALFDQLQVARTSVRDDRDQSVRRRLAKARREGETEEEHATRLKLWGLDDE